jgi:hypothetical protein
VDSYSNLADSSRNVKRKFPVQGFQKAWTFHKFTSRDTAPLLMIVTASVLQFVDTRRQMGHSVAACGLGGLTVWAYVP